MAATSLPRLAEPQRRLAIGLLSGLLGLLLLGGSVVLMNADAGFHRTDAGKVVSVVQVERTEKVKPPPQDRPKPPAKRQQRARVNPVVGLEGSLAGLNFGLPQFEQYDPGEAASILGQGSATMTDDSVDSPPRPIVQNPMPYPPRAKAQGTTGYVLLSVLIGPTGQVEKVKVLEASPPGVFDDAAVLGVQGWKFEPASYKGEAVRVWATQKVRFDLG
jgi:protein TonB